MMAIRVFENRIDAKNVPNGCIYQADDGNNYICDEDIWKLYCEWNDVYEEPDPIVPDASKEEPKPTKAKVKKFREPSEYNVFMKSKLQELKRTDPEMTNKDRMKVVSKCWRKMST